MTVNAKTSYATEPIAQKIVKAENALNNKNYEKKNNNYR